MAPKSVRAEEDLFDGHTFGGRLSAAEAERTHTTPGAADHALFAQSLHRATRTHRAQASLAYRDEDDPEWQRFRAALHAAALPARGRKKTEVHSVLPEDDPKAPVVETLHFGARWALRPWFSAPLPAELFETSVIGGGASAKSASAPNFGGAEGVYAPPHAGLPEGVRGVRALWMCEFCLRYFRSGPARDAHVDARCRLRPPPGTEVYRCGRLSVFEVDGRFSRGFCQRLALLARMFLDHKAVFYDVEAFIFYVLVEWSYVAGASEAERCADERAHPASWSLAGYFSKEKDSPAHYNLSCIATLPHHQRKGYGALLIDLSYLLTRVERAATAPGTLARRVADTPERPLSDLGLASYVKYWSHAVARAIVALVDLSAPRAPRTDTPDVFVGLSPRRAARPPPGPTACYPVISASVLSSATGIACDDIVATLEHLGLVRDTSGAHPGRMSKGAPPVLRAARVVVDGPALARLRALAAASERDLRVDPSCLRWVPYVLRR